MQCCGVEAALYHKSPKPRNFARGHYTLAGRRFCELPRKRLAAIGSGPHLQQRQELMRISLVMIASGAGGVQQTIVPYCEALSRAGHQLQVVLYRNSPMIPEVRALGIEPDFVRFPCQNKLLTALLSGVLKRKIQHFAPDIVIGFAGRGYRELRRALARTVPVITRVASLKDKALARLAGGRWIPGHDQVHEGAPGPQGRGSTDHSGHSKFPQTAFVLGRAGRLPRATSHRQPRACHARQGL